MSDQQTYSDLFIEVACDSSRQARSGKPFAYHAVTHILRTYHGWDQRRIDNTIRQLRESDQLLRTGNGLYLVASKMEQSLVSRMAANKVIARCAYCGRRLKKKEATKDHVIPSSRGGTGCESNIVTACRPCNNFKANRTPEEWARDILNFDRKKRRRKPKPVRRRLTRLYVSVLIFTATIKGVFNA